MKKTTYLLLIACMVTLFSNKANAKAEWYFTHNFSNFNTSDASNWTFKNTKSSTIVITDGAMYCESAGGDMEINFVEKHNTTNFEKYHFNVIFASASSTATYKIGLTATKSDGSTVVFATKDLANNAELDQSIEFKAEDVVSGTIEGGTVSNYKLTVSGGLADGDILVINSSYAKSKWVYPTLPGNKLSASGDSLVVRIESEDFDEGPFGVAYKTRIRSNQNQYRMDAPFIKVLPDSYESNGWTIQGNGLGEWDTAYVAVADRDSAIRIAPFEFHSQWTNYTVDVTTPFVGDLTLQGGIHDAVKGLRFNCNCPWVRRYMASYIIYLDGKVISHAIDYEGHMNDTIWVHGNGDWKSVFNPTIDCPSVNFTKGRHTIKVVSLAREWHQDCFEVRTLSSTVGINNNFVKDAINVYPNPTTDVINFATEKTPFAIVDLTGKLLRKGMDTKANVKEFDPGVYLLKVSGKTVKFIKK